jgi:Zn-dependent protease
MDTVPNNAEGRSPEDESKDAVQADSSAELTAAGESRSEAFVQQVNEHLDQIHSPKSSWRKNLVVLALTVALFVLLGLVKSTLSYIVILVGVLLVHESGHYLGMRLFGYRNVRMFFIPLFGAAVSGVGIRVSPLKTGIVLLLGPVPGIVLGVGLAFAYRAYPSSWLFEIGLLLVILNAFNLLPLLPMDGGRLFHLVLFSRNRYMEAAFSLFASLGLITTGWILDTWLLMGLGALMLMGISRDLLVNRIAREMRSSSLLDEIESEDEIPPAFTAAAAERILIEKPQLEKIDAGPRYAAQTVHSMWEKLTNDPPGIFTSLLLLAIYFLALIMSPLAMILLFEPTNTVVYGADGQSAPREEWYSAGMMIEWTEVGPDTLYHGLHESFAARGPSSLENKGRWENGFQHGEWKYYREGEVDQIILFDRGKIVGAKFPGDHEWKPPLDGDQHNFFYSLEKYEMPGIEEYQIPDQPCGPMKTPLWLDLFGKTTGDRYPIRVGE